jgi:predicted homoserine dehydrogenase-like protein
MNDRDHKELDHTPIRVGIIGAGGIARGFHLRELISGILIAGYEAAESGQTIELQTASSRRRKYHY